MSEFAGSVTGAQENYIVTASKGTFFVPQEKEWKSNWKRKFWIAVDVLLVGGFLLTVLLISL